MHQKPRPAIRLPAALYEQIGQNDDTSHTGKRRKQKANRKEVRKQTRVERKQRNVLFHSRPKTSPSETLKRPLEDAQHGPPKKRPRHEDKSSTLPLVSMKKPVNNEREEGGPTTSKKKQNVSLPVSKSLHKRASVKPLLPEEAPEDAQIAWLEAKIRKSKVKIVNDGLDDLLTDLDRIIPSASSIHNESMEDEALETEESEEDDNSIVETNTSDEEASDIFSEFDGFSWQMNADADEVNGTKSGVDPKAKLGNNKTEDQTPPNESSLRTRPEAETAYVPPHLRMTGEASQDSEQSMKLKRQIKGLLNRLSEQNIATILTAVEDLYRNQSRNDVTTTLTGLIIEGISSHSTLLDAFVVIHAALVSSLHKIVGLDFAAYFIQTLVDLYERHYLEINVEDTTNAEDDEPKGKECLNLVVLLSELYNFQVISCVLVYDVIRKHLDKLSGLDVELLLKIARNSGQQLQQDDPSALKDIIDIVHNKVSEKDKDSIKPRTKFMIETLTNLKNNKIRRPVHQAGHTESVERMKKFLSGLGKRHHVNAHEPLRITLEDLHSADRRGKWWIVGAAWRGDPLVEHAESRQDNVEPIIQPSDTLLKLARKQGMNTDIRRSIFVVLMSSNDCVDAWERLSQLNLNETQQREIVRVVLHCLGNEKNYNPFYPLVVQHLCQSSHSYKVTLQYCLWDFFRDMGEKDVGGAEILKSSQDESFVEFNSKKISSTRRRNVARAYGWWLAKGTVALTILKPVDFTRLKPQTQEFLRILFSQLFISTQVSSPAIGLDDTSAPYLQGPRNPQTVQETFMKATRIPLLSQGLLYMFKTIVREADITEDDTVSQVIKWGRGIALDALRAETDIT